MSVAFSAWAASGSGTGGRSDGPRRLPGRTDLKKTPELFSDKKEQLTEKGPKNYASTLRQRLRLL